MNDKTKLLDFSSAKLKKIKGHTRIELTSVIDGSKKIIEHDNHFQPGVLETYMESLGYFNNNPYNNNTWKGRSAWENLVGGVLLFRDAIDNDDGETEIPFMPPGNQMTANASAGVTNNGTPIELGSWNPVESSTGGNRSLTFVYDWQTHQGNGVIGSVCLTSNHGGYIGYGNPSGVIASIRGLETDQTYNTDASPSSGRAPIYNNYKYSFSVDTAENKITVYKTLVPVDKMGIFAFRQRNTVITYTGDLTWAASFVPILDMNKAYLFPTWAEEHTIVPNATYCFIEIDLDTEMATLRTVTNTHTAAVIVNKTGGGISVACGILWLPDNLNGTGTKHLIGFRISDSSIVKILTQDGYIYSGTQYVTRFSEDGLMLYCKSNYTGYSTNYTAHILDIENDTIYRPNTNASEDWKGIYKDGILARVVAQSNYFLYKNPLYLATINNLAEPVVKDNTQTMKVIYTLTEAEE